MNIVRITLIVYPLSRIICKNLQPKLGAWKIVAYAKTTAEIEAFFYRNLVVPLFVRGDIVVLPLATFSGK